MIRRNPAAIVRFQKAVFRGITTVSYGQQKSHKKSYGFEIDEIILLSSYYCGMIIFLFRHNRFYRAFGKYTFYCYPAVCFTAIDPGIMLRHYEYNECSNKKKRGYVSVG